MSSYRIVEHNKRINEAQRVLYSSYTPGQLVVGHKKDVVTCDSLVDRPNQVFIYGWIKRNGNPIQPLYGGHESTYCDYSHSGRPVLRWGVYTDLSGNQSTVDLKDVHSDPMMCKFVSANGKPIRVWRQPGVEELA